MSLHACCIDADSSMTEVLTPRARPESMNRAFGQRMCSGFVCLCSSPPPYLNQVLYNHTRRKKNVLLFIFFHTCSIHSSSLLLSPLLHPRPPPSTPVSYCLPAVLPTINLSANELGLSLLLSAATFFMFHFFFLFFVRLSTDPLTGM